MENLQPLPSGNRIAVAMVVLGKQSRQYMTGGFGRKCSQESGATYFINAALLDRDGLWAVVHRAVCGAMT